MADVCLNKNTVYRLNLWAAESLISWDEKPRISVLPRALLVTSIVFGKRLHHPSPSGVAFLVFLIVFNIITFPITAVLNALVMASVKAKLRLRALLAFLPLTDFTVGILVQATFAAMLIMLLPDETRVYCVWQVLRYASIFVRCFLALPLDFF